MISFTGKMNSTNSISTAICLQKRKLQIYYSSPSPTKKVLKIGLLASYWFKPRAKGRNIVDQQLPTLLFVCTLCCMWLVVVAQSFKLVSGQTFSQRLQTFLLFRDRRSAVQRCWIRLHSSSKIVGATNAHYAFLLGVYKVLWVVSLPWCTAGLNMAGSCCIRLHTTANMDTTTPNIVSCTMLEVVGSIFT